jgi:hypothetical protein
MTQQVFWYAPESEVNLYRVFPCVNRFQAWWFVYQRWSIARRFGRITVDDIPRANLATVKQ